MNKRWWQQRRARQSIGPIDNRHLFYVASWVEVAGAVGTYKTNRTYHISHITIHFCAPLTQGTIDSSGGDAGFTVEKSRSRPAVISALDWSVRVWRRRLRAARREREDGRTLHEVAALHLNLLQLGSELDGRLGEARRRIHINVLDADAVDSVALVRRRLVLSVKDVAQVRAAAVADNLEALHVSLDADVALVAGVVAILERVPTAVLELGGGGIKRVLARAARKVALLREEGVVLAGARSLSAGLAKALELLLR